MVAPIQEKQTRNKRKYKHHRECDNREKKKRQKKIGKEKSREGKIKRQGQDKDGEREECGYETR